jgi:hypothetical protein
LDEKELAEKVNAILAEILTEASYIAAESEELITMNDAIAKAIYNVANDPDGTLH